MFVNTGIFSVAGARRAFLLSNVSGVKIVHVLRLFWSQPAGI